MIEHSTATNRQEYTDRLLANGPGSETAKAYESFDVPTFVDEAIADLSMTSPAAVLDRILALPLLSFSPSEQETLYGVAKCVQRLISAEIEAAEATAAISWYAGM